MLARETKDGFKKTEMFLFFIVNNLPLHQTWLEHVPTFLLVMTPNFTTDGRIG